MANYCRSPVAERLLRDKYQGSYSVISAGLTPLAKSTMDTRSISFLEKYKIDSTLHSPKKITTSIVRNSKIIFALDIQVLMELNNAFPSYIDRIKLLNYQHPQKSLPDPYILDNEGSMRVMEDLRYVVDHINI